MNKDTLERLRETVLVPHGDPQLVLYTKLVVGLLWLVHLPLGFLYGAPLPFYLLLGGMMLLDGVNLFLSRRSASRARELGAALAFLVGSALLFQKAYVGYFSWFFLLIFSFSCTFALGLVDGTFINLLSFLWVMACLRGGLIPDPAALYGESFVRRFPSFTSASSGWPTSSCSPSSATGWTRPNAIFYCSSASTRRRANSRRCR